MSTALLAASLANTASLANAADATPPGDCASVLPANQIEAGQKGTGWTVVQGSTPQPFEVTILGVQSDGIAPGHDLAIIEIADEPGSHFVADAGGIWAGMSGSPVYVDGKLAGAVSYTFSRGPSTIGGMTLAEDMLGVLSYGEPARDAPAVALGDQSRAVVAERLGTSPDAVASSFSRLPIPIVASGVAVSGLIDLEAMLDEQGFHGFIVPGSAASAPAAEQGFSRPVPGGNFAAVVSYGDVTVGGIGTTTYVCGDRAVAFGHSLAFAGATTFGASDASAIAIVDDPTDGPFKLASIGSAFGLLDQDRTAAIAATLGVAPDPISITARLRSLALRRTRFGASTVTMPQYVRRIASEHLLDNITAVTDSETGGSAVLRWTIRGVRSSGEPFELHRVNRMVSGDDIGLAAAVDLLLDLANVDENKFESVEFSGVDISGRISAVARQDRIVGVEVSKNGASFAAADQLTVAPGDELALRVSLRKPSGAIRVLETDLVVPADATGTGRIVIAGGSAFSIIDCFTYPESCPDSFARLIEVMAAAPRADDVIAELSLASSYGHHWRAKVRDRAVVSGEVDIDVTVTGQAATANR